MWRKPMELKNNGQTHGRYNDSDYSSMYNAIIKMNLIIGFFGAGSMLRIFTLIRQTNRRELFNRNAKEIF